MLVQRCSAVKEHTETLRLVGRFLPAPVGQSAVRLASLATEPPVTLLSMMRTADLLPRDGHLPGADPASVQK
jgi:hypothetical protein